METPYKKIYGKEADLRLLKVIGARAFAHIETHTKTLSSEDWEGRLCGYSKQSKA